MSTFCLDVDFLLSSFVLIFAQRHLDAFKVSVVSGKQLEDIVFEVLVSGLSVFLQKFDLGGRSQTLKLLLVFDEVEAVKLDLYTGKSTFLRRILRYIFIRYCTLCISV